MIKLIKQHLYLKLALIIISMIFLFTGFISYFLYQQSISALKTEAYGRLEQMAKAYGKEIDIDISNTMQITEMLSRLVQENFNLQNAKNHPGYLDQLVARYDPYVRAIAQDLSYAKSAYIYYNWKIDGTTHDIYYIDSNGDGIVTKQNTLPISYFDDSEPSSLSRNWWTGPIMSRKGYWTPPYKWIFDNGTSEIFISYTKAVFDENELLAVVGTDFLYENIISILSKIKVYDTGYPFLLNENQVMIAHPTYEGKALSQIDEDPYRSLLASITSNQLDPVEYKDMNQKKWILSFYVLENNWILGIAAPVSEITQSARSMTLFGLILLCFAVPLIILVTFLVSRRITSPIRVFIKTVKKIEEGELTPDMDTTVLQRVDELGTLGHVIQRMGFTLDEKIGEIIQKNALLETEILEKEKAKESFQLVYEAFSATQNGMIITTANFMIQHSNPAFARLLEFTEEPIGLSLENILKQVTQNQTIRFPNSAFFHQKIVIAHPDLPKQHLWLIMTRIENKDGTHRYIGILEDQTEAIHQAQSIEYLRDHDAQTGLLNKASALHAIHDYMSTQIDEAEIAALFTVNIDDFRLINEAMGYDCGDLVILEVASKLKKALQKERIFARTSGDEFLIFIKDINYLQEIDILAQKLLRVVQTPIRWHEKDLFITISIGISIYPFDSNNLDQLINYSVSALNSVKSTGKNSLKFYSHEIAESAFEKYELSNQLREALEKEEFFLLYQPIVQIDESKIWGVEALIRWNHPTKGIVSPNLFIPLAESNGTIVAIGDWVIEETCRQINRWKSMELSPRHVSINLSTIQLNNPQFADQMGRILAKHNIATSEINMEITESTLLQKNSVASNNLYKLKELGFSIHIDDFGTGFSSLAYLRDFNVNLLKIDRSFIKGIPETDTGDLARLIIDLGQSLGVDVIAEGVETKAQLDYLSSKNCHLIQGYYFSVPLTPEDFSRYVEQFGTEMV